MSNPVSAKNRASWNALSAGYSAREHADPVIRAIADHPARAFHHAAWELLRSVFPSFEGLRVCIPSSGDNHAAFALAQLGAQVTSCDISENQLANAERVARQYGWDIAFRQADTMALEGVPSEAYDFVYTSNGVHVWINDLAAMYRNIARVLKPGGRYVLFEIHPFQRPFDGRLWEQPTVKKPYDCTGPFESEQDVTFGWRLQDILNALLDAGLSMRRLEELFAEKNYEDPDWIPCEQKLREPDRVYDRAEVDRMYDWRCNPMAALPLWFSVLAEKE